jgi:hypothetical protein
LFTAVLRSTHDPLEGGTMKLRTTLAGTLSILALSLGAASAANAAPNNGGYQKSSESQMQKFVQDPCGTMQSTAISLGKDAQFDYGRAEQATDDGNLTAARSFLNQANAEEAQAQALVGAMQTAGCFGQ